MDQDGFGIADDCDDENSDINPDIAEIPYNGIDDDCDVATFDDDLDQDGFGIADDCDDENSEIFPGAEEIANNGIDEDCDGSDLITTSVGDVSDLFLNIYPIPTTDIINIETNQHISSIKLYDFAGRLIQEITSTERNVSVSHLLNGVYILEFKFDSNNSLIHKKIIVAGQ